MKQKPEKQISDWIIRVGTLYGTVNGVRVRVSNILKRPMNPKAGDKIETMTTTYILEGDRLS